MKRLITCLFFIAFSVQAETDKVSLPSDYRDTYTQYLSLDRIQNHDQIMSFFANDVAMQGRDKNGELPNGSLIVAEVYSVKKNEDGSVITSGLNRRIKDQLLLLALMEKQEGFEKASSSAINTGNWAFAAYKPNGDAAGKDIEACRACHAPLKDKDYLFSIEHLPEQK